MITHVVASCLAVSAERFWAEQVSNSEAVSTKGEEWPRSVTLQSKALFGVALHDTRTVEKASSGCKVVDRIGTDAKFKFLRAWVIAVRLMKFKRLHTEFQSKYGRVR
jgi:hypothetical protein